MKKILAVSLLTLLVTPWAANSADNSVEKKAKEEFKKCEIVTRRDRAQCNLGGCAAILRTCYDAEIDFLETKANSLSDEIKNPECLPLLSEFNHDIRDLTKKFDSAAILDSTWSGLEINISAELFRYKALSALHEECERK